MIDCVLIGINEGNFENHVEGVKALGNEAGAFRDLRLAYVNYDGKPYRALDLLNVSGVSWLKGKAPLSNFDFYAPALFNLGTYLRSKDLTFDSVNLFQHEKEKLRALLTSGNVLSVAITTTMYVTPDPIVEVVNFIRECNSNTFIILGGPAIYNQFELLEENKFVDFLEYLDADGYVISQEGEATLSKLVTALKKGTDLQEVPNIFYKSDSSFKATAKEKEANGLRDNMVRYDLFSSDQIGSMVSLRTAKSCPFSCSFCGFPERAGKYTYLDEPSVEKELNTLKATGTVNTLTFIDDTFNVPKERFKNLLRIMIKNKYGFRWNSFLRSDHVDDEAIELMKESGCEGVFLGVESGSNAILKNMNKTSRRENYLNAIPKLRKVGILTYASLVVGFPGETEATLRDTIDLIETAMPDFYRAQLWYCDPLTPIWKKKDEYGIKGSNFNWEHNTMNAVEACAKVDELFLNIKNSIWLPQWGFEMWSLFYLQRKGLTLQQIKNYVQLFNSAVRNNVVNTVETSVDARFLESVREVCRIPSTKEEHPLGLVS